MSTTSAEVERKSSQSGPRHLSELAKDDTQRQKNATYDLAEPSLEPYVGRLERFELFSTNQCYYVVGSNKLNTAYRIIKIDRTLIERAPQQSSSAHTTSRKLNDSLLSNDGTLQSAMAENHHTAKPTLRALSEFVTEDPNIYTQEEIQDMLDMIHDGNLSTQIGGTPGAVSRGRSGGLKPIVKAYGIVGFIRFLDCYYLTLITKRAKVGSIGGNGIYTIKNTETVPLKPSERNSLGSEDLDPSSVLLSMWNRGKRSVGLGLTNREIAELRYQGLYQVVDLSKSFFFSYTYDLTRSLQENFLATTTKPFPPPPFKDLYAWNHFLTKEFEGCLHSLTRYQWMVPIIHGAFVQRKINDYGRSLNLALIARRSRHFAGTRYLKRGASEQGKVANDVEHEQILHDESKSPSSGVFCSYLQVRGSIPTFWTQESSVTMPKPPIELNRVDPSYTASRLHFEDLMIRYSSPILVLDLVKQSEKREREVRVGNEYRHAVDFINNTIEDERHKIRYCALDYSHTSKHRNLDVSTSLNEVSTWAVNQTGFFCSSPKWKIVDGGFIEPFTVKDGEGAARLTDCLGVPAFPMEQTGVLRTNCIDCLDRTNVAQFSAGVEAMAQQLIVMGIRSQTKLDPTSNIVRVLIDMYVDIGDSIALQYGGSEAHKKVTADRSESTMAIGKHKELLTSIRRYYSNAFTDRLKQDAMNLFLGFYLPFRHSVPLWELETDYYLHNFHSKEGRGTNYTMKNYQRAFGVNIGTQRKGEIPAHTERNSARKVEAEETRRVKMVRNRLKMQHKTLSLWWKRALQSNIQQRMWMKLSREQVESLLPPRFERLYQPDKIAQFDRFFARSWATPVRRAHSAQHTDDASSDGGLCYLRRVISSKCVESARQPSESTAGMETTRSSTLGRYTVKYGYAPAVDPNLKRFVEHHNRDVANQTRKTDFLKLSQMSSACTPPEYSQYVEPSPDLLEGTRFPKKKAAEEEYKLFLHPFSLKADDVGGIRQLAESAHLNQTILSGPYRGLEQEDSAMEVATSILEQFNALSHFSDNGHAMVNDELKRRHLYSVGVKDTAVADWNSLVRAEHQYNEVVAIPEKRCIRSDLTTESSMRLYCSLFDDWSELSVAEMNFITGEQATAHATKTPLVAGDAVHSDDALVKKAIFLGIAMSKYSKPSSPSLVKNACWRQVPFEFEQINDDMFARKDNKFLVLNGVGVDTWSGSQSTTKECRLESIVFDTLS